LKDRKLVQWAIAYLAGAWVVYEVSSTVGGHWGLPAGFFRALFVIAAGLLAVIRDRDGGVESASRVAVGGSADDRPAIAVLPCDNLSPDSGDAYLAAGIHEEILLSLQRITHVQMYTPDQDTRRQLRRIPLERIAQLDQRALAVAAVEAAYRIFVIADRLRVRGGHISRQKNHRRQGNAPPSSVTEIHTHTDIRELLLDRASVARINRSQAYNVVGSTAGIHYNEEGGTDGTPQA
jgi:hypothetical protein